MNEALYQEYAKFSKRIHILLVVVVLSLHAAITLYLIQNYVRSNEEHIRHLAQAHADSIVSGFWRDFQDQIFLLEDPKVVDVKVCKKNECDEKRGVWFGNLIRHIQLNNGWLLQIEFFHKKIIFYTTNFCLIQKPAFSSFRSKNRTLPCQNSNISSLFSAAFLP